ncbi:MAG: hypothetical protein HRU00_03965 [Myxococcales bacterium]|nr:hypothetical protein [Myxococcales bacterium]
MKQTAIEALLALTRDPEPATRSRASREPTVVAAVEALQQDPDGRLRRRARGVMAAYRRTGKINQS